MTIRSDRAGTDDARADAGAPGGGAGSATPAPFAPVPTAVGGGVPGPADLSAEQLLAAYASGELSPV